MIDIVLVDDQTLVRQGIGNLLSMSDKVRVVGDAADGQQALQLIAALQPDIVLLDVRMPTLSGLDVLRKLKAQGCTIPVVMLTTFADRESLQTAVELGAKGYLLKDVSLDNLIASIELVVSGQAVFDHRIQGRDAGEETSAAQASLEERYELTRREITILEQLAAGVSNREIASQLGLKMGTVKNYVSSILLKLDVRNRTQVALKMKEEGWL